MLGLFSGTAAAALACALAGGDCHEKDLSALEPLDASVQPLTVTPAFISHTTIPWERWQDVASRYGVTVEQIAVWNDLGELDPKEFLRSNRPIRIQPQAFPAPRQKKIYTVRKGDSWKKIAHRFKVDRQALRNWNRREIRKGLHPGTKLMLWMDSSLPGLGSGALGPPVPTHFEAKPGAVSKGRPSRGRLLGGAPLPPSDQYTIRIPYQSYGTTLTVENTQRGIAMFRRRSAFAGEVVVSAMSRETGGRLRPHRSHQSGRDVDIWLPRMPHAHPGLKPGPDEVDWHAAWYLIEAFAEMDVVKRIYLDASVHRRLRRAAREIGVGWDDYRAIVHPNAKVVHNEGHIGHIHIRFTCGPDAVRCRG